MEDIDYHHPRGLDQAVMESLSICQWVLSGQNVIITGPTGSGKTYLSCALGTQACRQGLNTRYYQVSKLLSKLSMSRGDGTYPKFLNTLAKTDLVILDDFGLAPLNAPESRDVLEIIDDRSQCRSTIITAQIPIEHWHDRIGDPTVARCHLGPLGPQRPQNSIERRINAQITKPALNLYSRYVTKWLRRRLRSDPARPRADTVKKNALPIR